MEWTRIEKIIYSRHENFNLYIFMSIVYICDDSISGFFFHNSMIYKSINSIFLIISSHFFLCVCVFWGLNAKFCAITALKRV